MEHIDYFLVGLVSLSIVAIAYHTFTGEGKKFVDIVNTIFRLSLAGVILYAILSATGVV